MKQKPLTLSIVIPAHNEESYLGSCLDSIANQTVLPDEVIVVDNASTDRTREIASSYDFVKVVFESKLGIVHARNAGFNAVKSDLIGRIDADTILEPDWVEAAVGFFAANKTAQAATGACYFYDFPFKKCVQAGHQLIYGKMQRLIAGGYILWGSNTVLRRSAWLRVREACNLRNDIDEDIDLSIQLLKQRLPAYYLDDLVAEVSLRRGQIGVRDITAYVARWVRVYRVNQWYARSVGIWLLKCFMLGLTTPLSLLFTLNKKVKLGLKPHYDPTVD